LHCVSRGVSRTVGLLQLFGSSDGTFENISTKFTHRLHHRNDSTSLCTIHFIYILVLEDVIGSDVGGRFLLAHPVEIASLPQKCSDTSRNFLVKYAT